MCEWPAAEGGCPPLTETGREGHKLLQLRRLDGYDTGKRMREVSHLKGVEKKLQLQVFKHKFSKKRRI